MVSFEAAIKEAKLAIEHCYSVKKGENVAILTDQDHMVEAKALAAVAGQFGANVVMLDASGVRSIWNADGRHPRTSVAHFCDDGKDSGLHHQNRNGLRT